MTLLDRMALMNTQQNIKPPSESLEDFFKRSVATLANPALSMARGEQATPQDVIQAITGQQTRSWTDVTSETFPKIAEVWPAPGFQDPSSARFWGGLLDMIADPSNIAGMGMMGRMKKVSKEAPKFIGGILDSMPAPTIRDKFGLYLGKDAKRYLSNVNINRNKICIHPNQKTGLSIDFSTSCPARESGIGACPYCYVEHPRTGEMIKVPQVMGGKKIVDNPYRGEIASMPDDLIHELNLDGGIRMFSFGDYRAVTDYGNVAAALQDAEQKGLMIKAITKRPDFVKTWGDHPNLRINISTDLLPREMSNAPTIDEAVNLAGGRENIIDVVTLYHGPTNFNADGVRTDKLFKIVKAQNPELVKRVGEKKLKAELDTWENMPPMSKYGKDLQQRSSKVCCGGGKCSRDKTKCGFGVGSIIAGVYVPIWFDGVSDEQ